GSHVAEDLLQRGADVLAIDNFATGRPEHLSAHSNLTLVEGTIADPNLIMRLFGDFRPEVIVHTAASYKDPNDWYSDALTNVVGMTNLVRGSQDIAAKRFIYFQTALCYGVKPQQSPVRLDHPKNPANSSYAI